MARRFAFATALAVFLTGFGMVPTPIWAGHPPLVMKGMVEMASSPSRPVTTVTVDIEQGLRPPDGLVDQAFRVQQLGAEFVRYSGPATVTYSGTALIVETEDHRAWVFALPGATMPSPVPALAFQYVVVGISRFHGAGVNRSSDEVTSTLLTTGCGVVAANGSDPLCDNCESGGPGAAACSVKCVGAPDCDADCDAGYHACCSCKDGCGCCPNIEGQPNAGA